MDNSDSRLAEIIVSEEAWENVEISVDSRTVLNPPSCLFFALKGENHNGHDYVLPLYRRGVRRFAVSEMREDFKRLKDVRFYLTGDVVGLLQKVAAVYRRRVEAEVVGVTGSNGKTVVKEWISQMMDSLCRIYRSPRSYNSQTGVPLSVAGIPADAEIALIEAGISRPGEMERLEPIIRPEVGIFTHFGDAHDENFSSREEKLKEKAKLFASCKMVIGRGGPVMERMGEIFGGGVQLMRWGDRDCEVAVEETGRGRDYRDLRINFRGREFGIRIPFPDEASYENAMTSVCYMLYRKVEPEKIRDAVSRLQTVAMRMEWKKGINGCELINDYYNSDSDSFRLGLSAMQLNNRAKKRTVILSDFVNISGKGEALYAKVASQLSDAGVEDFIGIGPDICDCASCFGLIGKKRFYRDTDEFLRREEKRNFSDSVILIKGARKFRFEYIAAFLQEQSHTTVLNVDFDAMAFNLSYFRSLLPEGTKIAVMVKAFSYGSGAGEVARFLEYSGVDYLMVAFADEGVELRRSGIDIPIAVMNPETESFHQMIAFGLEPEIQSLAMLREFREAVKAYGSRRYPVHLKMNTGMNRSGFDRGDIRDLCEEVGGDSILSVRSMFSHLAGSDEAVHDGYTHMQLERFEEMTREIAEAVDYPVIRHILNSAGIERFPDRHYDMVRLGIGLHGISFAGAVLRPVSSFKTKIVSLRPVPGGETVGYGRKGVLKRDSLIAVVPVGYADGLSRRLSCGVGDMYVNGRRAPVVGNICMDVTMLDVTGIPVAVGDEVEIFGSHISVAEVAEKMGTIPYEVLTSVNQRVKRIYFKE